MIPSSDSPLERMISANSRWRGCRSVSSSSPLIPITAFIGVRISWLIVARNEPFAAFASSARRVCSSSCANRLRVGDGDRRLLGEGLHDPAMSRIERPDLAPVHVDLAVVDVVDEQPDSDHAPDRPLPRQERSCDVVDEDGSR